MSDVRSVLSLPKVYKFLQNSIRSESSREEYVAKYISAKEGDVVLDIGCGTADVLSLLPKVYYYGFDLSKKYIEYAKQRFGNRGTFVCQALSEATVPTGVTFNIVLANNILHHLNDSEVVNLLSLAKSCLKPGGRLVTTDGCHAPDEGIISRTILSLDRGKFVRTQAQYFELIKKVFSNVKVFVRNDMTKIPINTIIHICTNE